MEIRFDASNFIDGTEASAYVSGDPTRSLLQYQNENYEIDRSFFGKGCINGWGQDGTGGSDVPCTTRIVKTADNEDQKNGTYYNYQSTTSGSGASLKTDNANAPDTFCPLGWQLPYGGTGGVYYDKSKSWRFLFDAYDISYNEGNEPSSVKLRSYPLSYILGGYFGGATGRLYHQGDEGYHWGSTNNNSIYAYRITMWPRGLRSAEINSKLSQYPIRCL